MVASSRTRQTYDQLRVDLLDGRIPPGGKINIHTLSETLGVSPGAVREALSRLTSDGLVIAEPQKGFRVTPISPDDLRDLTAVRLEIEIKCLSSAIENADLAWEGRIQDIWHQLQHTPSTLANDSRGMNPDWADLHAKFHDVLVSGCSNQWWLRLRDTMFWQAERYRRMCGPQSEHPRNAEAEHAAIVNAVLERDAKCACALMTKHLNNTMKFVLGVLEPATSARVLSVAPIQ